MCFLYNNFDNFLQVSYLFSSSGLGFPNWFFGDASKKVHPTKAHNTQAEAS